MIATALETVGAARSIVVDEDNVILAGNGVMEAAVGRVTDVQVVDVAGDELVVVRRTGLTNEQKRALAMFDNRAGELATWNPDQLKTDAVRLGQYFSAEEIATLLQPARLKPAAAVSASEVTCPKCGAVHHAK
jgi:hypothetical protein